MRPCRPSWAFMRPMGSLGACMCAPPWPFYGLPWLRLLPMMCLCRICIVARGFCSLSRPQPWRPSCRPVMVTPFRPCRRMTPFPICVIRGPSSRMTRSSHVVQRILVFPYARLRMTPPCRIICPSWNIFWPLASVLPLIDSFRSLWPQSRPPSSFVFVVPCPSMLHHVPRSLSRSPFGAIPSYLYIYRSTLKRTQPHTPQYHTKGPFF